MSHQLNFYLSDKDMDHFETEISLIEPMLVLHNRSEGSLPRVIESSDLTENGHRQYFFYYVRTEELSSVMTHPVATQNYYLITETTSPVIELIRSGPEPRSFGRDEFISTIRITTK